MDDKLSRVWLTTFGLRLIILVVVITLFCGCQVFAMAVPLPEQYRDYRPLIFVGPMVLFLLLSPIWLLVTSVWFMGKRRKQLDGAFLPQGLSGCNYSGYYPLFPGRHYQGLYQGREVHAYFPYGQDYFSVARPYGAGQALDIYISTPLKTRLAIGTFTRFGKATGRLVAPQPMALTDPAYRDLLASAVDEPWARQLLDLPEAKALLLRLAAVPKGYQMRQVSLQPGAWMLRIELIPDNQITAEAVQQWLSDLAALAALAEAQPAPQVSAELTPKEYTLRVNRSNYYLKIFLIVMGIAVLVTLLLLAAIFMGSLALLPFIL